MPRGIPNKKITTVTQEPPKPDFLLPPLRKEPFYKRDIKDFWHKKFPSPAGVKLLSVPKPPKKGSTAKLGSVKTPKIFKAWTTLFYGHRGASKSLEQAKQIVNVLEYYRQLYIAMPQLPKAIVYSVQVLNPELTAKYKEFLYYWSDIRQLRYCPRENCWRGKDRHRLHGCFLVFDDIAAILPAGNWQNTPTWFVQMLSQARKFGIHIMANCQDPFSIDINFRRYVDMCFRTRKLMGSRDPDETRPPVKFIWGFYAMRQIKAEVLWQLGDMSENEIMVFKDKNKRMSEINKTPNVMKDVWRGSLHWIGRKKCNIYDTTQQVKEYKPQGFQHLELMCNDPEHPNCGYKKVTHEVI